MEDRRRSHGYERGGGGQGGYKRRREDDDDYQHRHRTSRSTLAFAIKLCDKHQEEEEFQPFPEQIAGLQKLIIRDLHTSSEQVLRLLLDCAAELSHKTPIYATLIGLINTEEHDFVEKLIQAAKSSIEEALQSGNRDRARLLLRLLVALVPSNVLHASTALRILRGIVEDAIEIADKGGEGKDKERIWQPYTDFLVSIVLLAMPWGGPELAEGAPEEKKKLEEEVQKYMDLRPSTHTSALRPFFVGDDPASMSDSGSASFLGQLWEAIQEMDAAGKWRIKGIPTFIDQSNEVQLANGTPHSLSPITIPKKLPCFVVQESLQDIEAAAVVLAAFPPRGGIRLLPPETIWGNLPQIERIVAEEYILDTIHFYDGDRVECARVLALGLPLAGKPEPIITETIFAQMLRVPSPFLRPIAYATILADICRLLPAVPRSMSTCMRELFQRIGALDPQLRTRLAEWLAYHLSNFDFMWPWAKWAHVLQLPEHNPQRRFVVDTFSKLIRLSYYANIKSKVPEDYAAIFPPEPKPQPLIAQTTPEQANGHALEESQEALQSKWTTEFIGQVKAKKTVAEMLAWISDSKMEEELGNKQEVLAVSLRGLMLAGSKSFTHMLIALERYDDLLTNLLKESGEAGQIACVSTAADVWRDAPQRAAQSIDRLMAHRLVDGSAIVRWAFGSPGLQTLSDQTANSLAWEVVYNAVNKTLARTQDAREELQSARKALGPELAEVEASNAAVKEETMEAEKVEGMLDVVDDSSLADAKRQLPEKQADLAEAHQTEKDLFLLCFKLFKKILDAKQPEGSSPLETEAWEEWHIFTRACLRAFTRTYHAAAAPLANSLESGIFAADSTSPEVHLAFVESLHI